jgi:ribosomal protein S18 acetylase RimI-like enzyme
MGGAGSALVVVRARPHQADTVLCILQDVQRWLHARGINQGVVPPAERLRARVARGEVCLAEVDGRAAATVTLSPSGEPFWDDPSGEGAYVHNLAVRREFGGRGLGRELLRRAEGATLLMGRRYLRLDIWGENGGLFDYYRSAGFVHVRDDRSQGWLASLFQKDLGTGMDEATDRPTESAEIWRVR